MFITINNYNSGAMFPRSENMADGNLRNEPTVAEIVALGNRLESEICEFQAEMRNGRIYAGRAPLEDDDWDTVAEPPDLTDEEITGKTSAQVMAELDAVGYKGRSA